MSAQRLIETTEEAPRAGPAKRAIVLLGNPNTGKSTLFTALTGARQKVANYPGVTVEAKLGLARFENTEVTVIDLPGTYSLEAHSPDERVAIDALLGRLPETPRPDGVIVVADASSLDRNLYLATQVLEFGLPVVIALTMVDVAKARGIEVDIDKLSRAIGVPVIALHAPRREGLTELKTALDAQLLRARAPLQLDYPEGFARGVEALHARLVELQGTLGYIPTRPEALRLLVNADGPLYREAEAAGGAEFGTDFKSLSAQACGDKPAALIEAQVRYGAIAGWLRESRTQTKPEGRTLTDRADAILTDRLWGTLSFVLVMGLLFQSIYAGARPLMDLVEREVASLGGWVGAQMAEGPLRGLIVQGVIGGAGGVLAFLPQILMLFLFIAVLEDLGYMSRAAFLMDRLMSRFGLTGKSFIPLLNSFACAVPAIMGTRVIEERNTRLTTIFLAPFMSCSARLPVYTVMIAAFVPRQRVLGFLSLQGLVLFAMYCVGALFAIPTALVLKRGILKGKPAPFLLELPSYKLPRPRAIFMTLVERGGAFVKRAGTIILAVSVL
ncbi:MAG TPA: ferrous iron transport protein B, partial [Polyangiaceae bacterium]|nr:ferrous iron transport protein B [Polyangiaceae bacterium]